MPKRVAAKEIEYVVIRLPKEYIEKMDELISKGHYSSRSDLIRDALRMLFKEYLLSPTQS